MVDPKKTLQPTGRSPIRTLTPIMIEVMQLRDKLYSYPQIAEKMGKAVATVYESHMAALEIVGLEVPKAVAGKSSINEYRRLEMHGHAEAVMREYWDTYREARDKGQLKVAIDALNGLRGWTELVIKLHGTSAPVKHEVALSLPEVEREIANLEGKLGADGSYDV